MVIWETDEDAKVPFLLRFNINTQLRYLNTLSSDETYTDHLGVDREDSCATNHGQSRDVVHPGSYVFSAVTIQLHRVDVRRGSFRSS